MQLRPDQRPFNRWLFFLPLLFPALLILPGLADFPYPPVAGSYSDLAVSHYPAIVTLKRLILEYRQLPLWSPHLHGGAPLAANPLYSLYYPPAWLALVLPLPAAFNLLVFLHLVWGGLGMLRLLQAEGLRPQAAVLGGLAFAALPKLYAHYGAGHLTLLYAVPWTPWLLLAWRQTGLKLFWTPLRIDSGVILGVVFLADPRWAAYAGLLWVGYALSGFLGSGRRWHYLGRLAAQFIIALLIAAPLAIPLLEYTRLSTRASLTPTDNLELSLPIARLLGLLFPSLGGAHEVELYPGALVLLLVVLTVFWGAVRKRAVFWLVAAVLSVLWALGENLPGMRWLAALPGFDLLRVPSRSLFLAGMAFAAAAAYLANALLRSNPSEEPAPPGRLELSLAGVAFFAVLLAGGGWLVSGQPAPGLLLGAVFVVASASWVALRLRGVLSARLWLVGCLFLLGLDLGVADRFTFRFQPAQEVLDEKAGLVAYLAAQPDFFRVYSPSYSMPQQVSAIAGLEQAGGVDPLQIRAYASFFSLASGVAYPAYSVTLPPFASSNPAEDNREAIPDARRLGLLNVAFIAAEYPLDAPGLDWVGEFDGSQLYRNTLAMPRAWLQPAASPLGEEFQPIASVDWSPNRIEVRLEPALDSPAMLVFSEILYPGWEAEVDGNPVQLEAAESLLRAVRLEAGARSVVLSFRPLSVVAGLVLGCLGLVLAFLLSGWSR